MKIDRTRTIMSSDQTDKCVRCSSELAEGESYCAACGHSDIASIQIRSADLEMDLAKRREKLGVFRRIGNVCQFFWPGWYGRWKW
jgi:hypothetical protein